MFALSHKWIFLSLLIGAGHSIVKGKAALSRGLVLIAEDNMDSYKLVRFILEHNGHETFLAVIGRDNVAATRLQKPDLTLMVYYVNMFV